MWLTISPIYHSTKATRRLYRKAAGDWLLVEQARGRTPGRSELINEFRHDLRGAWREFRADLRRRQRLLPGS